MPRMAGPDRTQAELAGRKPLPPTGLYFDLPARRRDLGHYRVPPHPPRLGATDRYREEGAACLDAERLRQREQEHTLVGQRGETPPDRKLHGVLT